ncbi:MAG: hypothetical protein INR71_03760 [Terriglobus roseus]|nr:hypothetical protein [Terriglobus roseus]
MCSFPTTTLAEAHLWRLPTHLSPTGLIIQSPSRPLALSSMEAVQSAPGQVPAFGGTRDSGAASHAAHPASTSTGADKDAGQSRIRHHAEPTTSHANPRRIVSQQQLASIVAHSTLPITTPGPMDASQRARDAGIAGASSQESIVSEQSAAGSAVKLPGLHSASSNVSSSTLPESDLTSPASSTGLRQQGPEVLHAQREAAMAAAVQLKQAQDYRVVDRASTLETGAQNGRARAMTEGSAVSPMAIDGPYLQQLHQASKRTASGTVKPASLNGSAPAIADAISPIEPTTRGHSRSSSAVSGVNKLKISEVSLRHEMHWRTLR